jgi:hypothetical protein
MSTADHVARELALTSTASSVKDALNVAVVGNAPLPAVKRFVRQQVPDSILHDAALNESIKVRSVSAW